MNPKQGIAKNEPILIEEDEVKAAEILRLYLVREGYKTLVSHNGRDALALIKSADIALVILDLMLPDISGTTICQTIRRQSRLPVIMLTAKIGEKDCINGLDIGADDYLVKPISPRIVVAKVKALLRRLSSDELVNVPIQFAVGLSIDFKSGIVKKNGKTINLTPTEYKLLSTMAKAPNRIFTRDQLISFALDGEFNDYDRTIDTYIMTLRAKIEDDRGKPRHIATVHGLGYKFENHEP
jgi:DNA-binding response OmpR family regulator